MADDPNADLIGYVWVETIHTPREANHRYTVIETTSWSDQYVWAETDEGKRTTRPAGTVRRHKQLVEGRA